MKKTAFVILLIMSLLQPVAFADVPGGEATSDGISLYREFCANCHGTYARTLIPDRSSSRISSAIRTLGVMAYLKNLTPEQIDLIADSLRSTPAG